MNTRPAYRDREDEQVAVLDALLDRGEEGMTVLELRAAVDADIDTIESALTELKQDDLITVDDAGDSTTIKPTERALPDPETEEASESLVDAIRDRLPF